MNTIIDCVIPRFPTLDMERTVAFYRDRLGFTLHSLHNDDTYAIMSRDNGVELHFWICDDLTIPKATGCYWRVRNIDSLYREYEAAGVLHPNGALENKPWGMREFSILDPDGNLISIGEVIA